MEAVIQGIQLGHENQSAWSSQSSYSIPDVAFPFPVLSLLLAILQYLLGKFDILSIQPIIPNLWPSSSGRRDSVAEPSCQRYCPKIHKADSDKV
ncbi:MAG: hypothetical protein KME55_06215 [Nostoc indistinguendum CM1-VF10]|nr:hypothetical protein [Nostoc indistinguendum CM1-VF10]